MDFERLITTIDAHVEGMPIRLITGGIPSIQGRTMAEKTSFFKEKFDHIRTSLVHEPRGHSLMTAALMTPSSDDETHFGAIFMSPRGYMNFCGHGSMGIAIIAVETGLVEATEPITQIKINTPAGPVCIAVSVEKGRARKATLEGVPSFFYGKERVRVPGVGELPVEIAYGGANCAFIEAQHLGIKTNAEDIVKAESLLGLVREAVTQQIDARHPKLDLIRGIQGVILTDKPVNPNANIKLINAGPHGRLDRSPCGIGTSAKLAVQYSKGELAFGQSFVTESVIGTLFHAKVNKEVSLEGVRAVVPEISGCGFITGIHHFVIQEDDPFKHGFQV